MTHLGRLKEWDRDGYGKDERKNEIQIKLKISYISTLKTFTISFFLSHALHSIPIVNEGDARSLNEREGYDGR